MACIQRHAYRCMRYHGKHLTNSSLKNLTIGLLVVSGHVLLMYYLVRLNNSFGFQYLGCGFSFTLAFLPGFTVSEWTIYINPTTSQMYTVFRPAFCYRK